MAGNKPPPPPPPPAAEQDPRCARFLAAAAPVVAMERGLTTLCRAKLATIADDFGLNEAEFESALAQLQLEVAEPEPPPLAIAWHTEKFRKYVGKKLSKLQVPVLTPDQEDRLVAIAAQRYSLPEPPARQVVNEVARDRNVRRIERSFAEKNVDQLIEKVVGDAVRLSQRLW